MPRTSYALKAFGSSIPLMLTAVVLVSALPIHPRRTAVRRSRGDDGARHTVRLLRRGHQKLASCGVAARSSGRFDPLAAFLHLDPWSATRNCPLRRPRELDGARLRERPRNRAPARDAVLRPRVALHRDARRHGGEVRGRRRHGRLRHPAGSRGRRGARRAGGARDPRVGPRPGARGADRDRVRRGRDRHRRLDFRHR